MICVLQIISLIIFVSMNVQHHTLASDSAPLGTVYCVRPSNRFRFSVELELGIQPNYIILVMEKNVDELESSQS